MTARYILMIYALHFYNLFISPCTCHHYVEFHFSKFISALYYLNT